MGTTVFLLTQVVSLALCMQTPCDIQHYKDMPGPTAICRWRNFTSVSEKLSVDIVELYLLDTRYPPGIWNPLRNRTFPCSIFLPLTKLIRLFTDFPWHYIEKCTELRNLRSLKSVKTVVMPSSIILRNDSFTYLEFAPVQILILSGISHLSENGAFCPLKNLTYLKIDSVYDNNITLYHATLLCYGLINKKSYINHIDLHGLQEKESFSIDTVIDRKVVGYLPEICVKRLDLSNNRLMAIKKNTFQEGDMFIRCIEHLDLSGNYIRFDIKFYLHVPSMINLKRLDLSQNDDRFLLHIDTYPPRCHQYGSKQKLNMSAVNSLIITLPPKLEYLNLSKISNSIIGVCSVTFSNEGNLRVLDLSYNRVLAIGAYVQGLSNISHLDISGMDIDEDIFKNTDMFTNVEKLIARKIDIYSLFRIPMMSKYSDLFLTMTKLTHLDLSGNHFSHIPLALLSMPSLIYLDLSSNSINIIRKEERDLLDKKYEKKGRFYLNISGNSIVCTCYTLNFVLWLHETRITLGNKGNYSCLTDYGTMTYTTNFHNDILLHWRQCVGHFWLTVAVSLQLVIIKCLMSAFLLKKYFPKVEYQILRWLGKLDPKRWDYEYDAYICYEDKEYQWPCLCLYKKLLERDETINLYLPDLHDPFGEIKAEVIHSAIKMSWKLIIVVTEDLFTDEWSYFKVLEALRLFSQVGVTNNRIILLYQDMSPEDEARVPKVLLNVVPRKNILQVIPGNDFWMDLRCMIVTEDMNMDILF